MGGPPIIAGVLLDDAFAPLAAVPQPRRNRNARGQRLRVLGS